MEEVLAAGVAAVAVFGGACEVWVGGVGCRGCAGVVCVATETDREAVMGRVGGWESYMSVTGGDGRMSVCTRRGVESVAMARWHQRS